MRTIALWTALTLLFAAAPARAAVTLQDAERGYLGVQITASDDGVEILSVLPGTAAAEAGLAAGDAVLAVDGEEIGSLDVLGEALSSRKPGDTLKLKLRRGGEERVVSVTLGRRGAPVDVVEPTPKPGTTLPPPMSTKPRRTRGPENVQPETRRGWLGVYVEPTDEGLRIDDTVEDGPAAEFGLEPGDVVLSVDGTRVDGTDALVAALRKAGAGAEVDVTVMRGETPREFVVRLRPHPDDVSRGPRPEPSPEPEPSPRPEPAPEKPRGWLGVTVHEVERGVQVDSATVDGPAASAGLEPADVIVSIGGRAVEDLESLRSALAKAGAGKTVAVTVLRGDVPREFDVTLGASPGAVAVRPLQPVEPPRGAPEPPGTPATGDAPRRGGFLGVMIATDPQGRALVASVTPGSPAAKARIVAGDVVVALDGEEVADAEALQSRLTRIPAGTEVEVTVERGDEHHHRTVRLAEYGTLAWRQAQPAPTPGPGGLFSGPRRAVPPTPPTPPARPAPGRGYLGVSIEDADGGVRVTEVHDDTAAARAGLREGDVITRVDAHRVRTTDDLIEVIARHGVGDRVELRIERGDDVLEPTIALGRRPNVAAVAPPQREGPGTARSVAEARRAAERAARMAKREAAAAKTEAKRAARHAEMEAKRAAHEAKAAAKSAQAQAKVEAARAHAEAKLVAEMAKARAKKAKAEAARHAVTDRAGTMVWRVAKEDDHHAHGVRVVELESHGDGPSTFLVVEPGDDTRWIEKITGDHGDHDVIIVKTKKQAKTAAPSHAKTGCHHCCHHCCCCCHGCGEEKGQEAPRVLRLVEKVKSKVD